MYIKKRYLIITLMLVIALLIPTAVTAAEAYIKTIEVSVNAVDIFADGKLIEADNFIYNDTAYVPLRVVSEVLGADVSWDYATKTAKITLNGSNSDEAAELRKYVKVMHAYKILESVADRYYGLLDSVSIILSALRESDYAFATEMYNNTYNYLVDADNDYRESIDNIYDYFLPDGYDDTNIKCAMYYIEHLQANVNLVLYFNSAAIIEASYSKYTEANEYITKGNEALIKATNNRISACTVANEVYNKYRLAINEAAVYKIDETAKLYLLDAPNYVTEYDYFNNNWKNVPERIPISPRSMPTTTTTAPPVLPPTSATTTPPTEIIIPTIPVTTPNPVVISNPDKIVIVPAPQIVAGNYAFPFHLYSNDGKVYLGKCVTDEMDKDSIYYKLIGDYSSAYSQTSIWNNVGKYGSQVSDESAFKDWAQKPPKIVDNNGSFVAYLSTNERIDPRWTIEQLRQFLVNNNQ